MQMVIGLIVLVLLAVGVWWYMGSGTPTDTVTDTSGDVMMEDDKMMEEAQ